MTETILSVGLGTLPDLDGPHDDPAALLTGRLHLRAAQDLEALGVTQLMLDDVLDAGLRLVRQAQRVAHREGRSAH